MEKIKALQIKLQKGKITKEEYLAQLKALLDGKEIEQAEHDEAVEFDPQDPDQIPRYSQADVDRMIVPKSLALLRKQLKAEGIEIEAGNKELVAKAVQLIKAGQGKLPAESELQKEVETLRKTVAKTGDAAAVVKKLTLENSILKAAGKFKPVNPAQVARAISDYEGLLEYDDDDKLVPKSVEKALKRMAEVEPNLFHTEDGDDDGDDRGTGSSFRGKGPGGPNAQGKPKDQKEFDTKKAEALKMMGIDVEKK